MSEIVFSTYGTYRKQIYRNSVTGYTVFSLLAADERKVKAQNPKLSGIITCVGVVPEYRRGAPLYLEGTVEQSKHGTQVTLTKCEERSWNETSLATYLSNICEGVGLSIGTSLARIYGNSLFDLIKSENAPAVLSKRISSLSYETALALCNNIANTQLQKVVFEEIAPFNGTWLQAMKIVEKYGMSATKKLQDDPYAIGAEIGIDFFTCDRIARKVGKSALDPSRIRHALIHAFAYEKMRGNVYSVERDICAAAQRVIEKSAFEEKIPSSVFLNALSSDDQFVFEFDADGYECVYLKELLNAETTVAEQLHRLMHTSVALNYNENIVDWAQKNCGIQYADKQRESFKLIRRSGVAIVTGGPGTGKTTTVNGLISAYEKQNPNKTIRLCAPTGRAAQRMTESTGREAVTIHRLLEYRPYGADLIYKTAADPIDADLIVVDEASMLDVELAAMFLSAVPSGALVLFIGDIYQLPSVGAGDVLNDMISSEEIPTVQLNAVYRQGKTSTIVVNANRINNGETSFAEAEDYRTITCGDQMALSMSIIREAARMYDRENPFETQVLSPTHKGEAGVSVINSILQDVLNPAKGQAELKCGTRVYRVGDKVILTNNNYAAGYFNGDIGVVKGASANGLDIDAFGKIIHIDRSNMGDVMLAYAITVHKVQGSEFSHVIISMPSKPCSMLKRNLLYTAVTRAKKSAIVFSEGRAVQQAAETCETGRRNTRLADRLRILFGHEPQKRGDRL